MQVCNHRELRRQVLQFVASDRQRHSFADSRARCQVGCGKIARSRDISRAGALDGRPCPVQKQVRQIDGAVVEAEVFWQDLPSVARGRGETGGSLGGGEDGRVLR